MPAGPLFNEAGYRRFEKYVGIGREEGELLFGGKRYTEEPYSRGFYVLPTAFLLPDGSGRLAREEVFGPILAIIPFDTEDDANRLANDVDFGLSASIWSADQARVDRLAPQIQAGTVWGGFKLSGVGKEGGPEGLEPYYQSKRIWWG